MSDLSGIMANLELQDQYASPACGSSSEEVTESTANPPPRNLRRSSTNSISKLFDSSTPNKRRCSLKPRNLNNMNIKWLESYYRNEKFKQPVKKSLETIYEEPLVKSGTVLLLGATKHRRMIFSGKVTKDKLKKRKTRIKKIVGGKYLNSEAAKKGQRLSMDAFLSRLHTMMSKANAGANNEADSITPPP